MGRLVVATHLPYHGLTVLQVVPQRIVTPLGRNGGGIDANLVVCRAHDNLLAPVSKDIAQEAGCSLGVVVGHGAFQGFYDTFFIFNNSTGSILAVDIVESFFTEIAVPVDTHIVGYAALLQTVNMTCRHAADGCIIAREGHSTRIVVGEVSCYATAIVLT